VSPRAGLEGRVDSGFGDPAALPRVNWVGDMSDAAVELARTRDVAVACVGSDPIGNAGWGLVSSAHEGKEGVDRTEITLTPMYFRGEPQYWFGHGLSYATFAYRDLRLSADRLEAGGTLALHFELANTSRRPGEEVVQLYARRPESQLQRPRRQLCGFARVELPAGAVRTIEFELPAAELAHWDPVEHAWALEPGRVELEISSSAANDAIKLTGTVELAA
jgi:hypothetical protein